MTKFQEFITVENEAFKSEVTLQIHAIHENMQAICHDLDNNIWNHVHKHFANVVALKSLNF